MHPQGCNVSGRPGAERSERGRVAFDRGGPSRERRPSRLSGRTQTRRRAISAASSASSNADMLRHRRSCRPANGCTPERSGRVSRRAAGFASVGGICRPPAKSQTGPTASRSVCGVTENTALWRASVSAANQCAPNTPAHLSDQKHGPSTTGQHQRSKPYGQDQRAWWRSHASAVARQRGVPKS
jgi:hypothetical protein